MPTAERIALGIIGTIAAAIIALLTFLAGNPTTEKITGYDSCVTNGGVVTTSYPAHCITPDGQSFTQTFN